MPEEEKKTVDIDTSGPDATVDIEEVKDESVVETEATKQETETTDKETDKTFENERETKLDKKDNELEEYSKGVQSRIAKLTRKMREAERREQAAVEYAKAVEQKRQTLERQQVASQVGLVWLWVHNVIRIKRDIQRVRGAKRKIGLCLQDMQVAE